MSDSFAELEGRAVTDLIRLTKLVLEYVHLQCGAAQRVFSTMRLAGAGRFHCSCMAYKGFC